MYETTAKDKEMIVDRLGDPLVNNVGGDSLAHQQKWERVTGPGIKDDVCVFRYWRLGTCAQYASNGRRLRDMLDRYVYTAIYSCDLEIDKCGDKIRFRFEGSREVVKDARRNLRQICEGIDPNIKISRMK